MSVKRRDSKNRILRNGESQDKKTGRYIYKYYDILHKPHFLYSWKLEPTDKLLAGKKDDLSLCEKIRLLQKDLADGIYILFHTGLRISEFVGLTISDLDMKNKTIRIDHQLQRKSDGTKYIETPGESGISWYKFA